MTNEDKPKFLELLNALFGAHNRTVWDGAVSGYWKGLEKMSVMQFERCVDRAIEKLQHSERGVTKIPTVGELWDISRGIRRYDQPTAQMGEPQWNGDAWDTAANFALLAYLSKATKASRYAPDSHHGQKSPGPQTKARTAILVKWKNAWARDMREDRQHNGNMDGKPFWFDCMRSAEAEIDKLIATQEAA